MLAVNFIACSKKEGSFRNLQICNSCNAGWLKSALQTSEKARFCFFKSVYENHSRNVEPLARDCQLQVLALPILSAPLGSFTYRMVNMRSIFILISLSALSGCSSMGSIQSQCGTSNSPYLDEWNCIKNSIVQGKAGNISEPQRETFIAAGDDLAAQVKSGKKSDSQAKADLAAELARTGTAARSDQDDSTPHLCNRGGGLIVCNN